MVNKLLKAERLRGLATIRELFESGNQGFCYPFRYLWRAKEMDEHSLSDGDLSTVEENSINASILISIPKRNIRRANKRNLLKRRCREAYRLNKRLLDCETTQFGSVHYSVNIALIYSTKEIHQYKTVSRAVQKILKEIVSSIEKGGAIAKTSGGYAANTTR